MKELSEAKRKELETRARLGPRLGRAPSRRAGPTAPPRPGGARRSPSVGNQHPTRDSGQ